MRKDYLPARYFAQRALVAANYAFRLEQSNVVELNNMAAYVNSPGSVEVCNFSVRPAHPPLRIVDARLDGDMVRFSFATITNRTYSVQYTDSLNPSQFKTLITFVGVGTQVTISDRHADRSRRFYIVTSD